MGKKMKWSIFIGCIAIVLFLFIFTRPNKASWVYPMKLYGSLPCVEGGTGVTFVILTSDDISLVKNTIVGGMNITAVPALTFPEIDDDVLTISNIRCTDAMSVGGGTCWMLEADLTSNPSCQEDSVDITRICYDEVEYEIGHLQILLNRTYETDTEALSLKSNAAGSIGRGLKPYHAEFLNTGDSSVESYDVLYPMYEDASNHYTIDGDPQQMAVRPGSRLYVESDFSACHLEEADFYYVTPILTYQYKGKTYSACLTPYNSGFQLDEEDVRYYMETYGK